MAIEMAFRGEMRRRSFAPGELLFLSIPFAGVEDGVPVIGWEVVGSPQRITYPTKLLDATQHWRAVELASSFVDLDKRVLELCFLIFSTEKGDDSWQVSLSGYMDRYAQKKEWGTIFLGERNRILSFAPDEIEAQKFREVFGKVSS